MTVNMASTDKASSPPMRYSSHDARGIDDLGRSAGVGWVVQAGSAGESHEQGETEREDGNCMNRRRGTRANNGKGRSRKSRRPKHNQSSCSEEGTVERREDCVESFRRETHWEPRSDGDAGLEAELFPMPLPGELHTSASKKDGGNNGLGRAVSAKEIGKSSEDISGGRRSEGVADWRSDSYTVHPKGEKSNTKSSPRTSTLEMTSAARTAYHPVEKGAQRSSSTVLAESVSQRRERRSENRLLCQTRRVEDGDQYVMERKQQAKRLALEVAKLRSALRVSNSDLAAERKARARLEVRLRRASPFCHGDPLPGAPFGRRYRTVQIPSLLPFSRQKFEFLLSLQTRRLQQTKLATKCRLAKSFASSRYGLDSSLTPPVMHVDLDTRTICGNKRRHGGTSVESSFPRDTRPSGHCKQPKRN